MNWWGVGRPLFHSLLCLVIVIALIGAFRIGLDRGFDHTIGAEAWGRLLFGIGGAISQMAHGSKGYVVDTAIEGVLQGGGLTGDSKILASLGVVFPANLRDAALIDAAIQKAVRWPGPFSVVRGSSGDDPGMVDFVRLAFSLFGYHLLSLYLTYFLLFAIPVWVFFHVFRDRPACLAVLAVAVLGHLGIFASSVFDMTGETLGSPTNPRFLSVLAVIPGLHLALAMVLGLPASRRNVGLTSVQAVMIVFACWIRASAVWVPFALALLALAVGIHARSSRPVWSFGLFAGLWLLHGIYLTQALNPVYRRNGDIGRHPMWHSIFYSLQFHPEWQTKYAPRYENAGGDDLSPMVAKKYFERHPPANLRVLYFHAPTGTLKWTAIESAVRNAFFEFLVADPKFVVATFVVHKPRYLIEELRRYAGSLEGLPAGWRSVTVVVWLAMTAFFAVARPDARVFTQAAAVLTGGFLISLIPILLTVPTRAVISDQFFMLVVTGAAWSVAAPAGAVNAVIGLGRARGWFVRRATT